MVDVLILVGAPPARPTVLVDAIGQLRAKGARVAVAVHPGAGALTVDGAPADVHEIRAAAGRSPARVEPARAIWLDARRDPWLRQRARRADVLVAVDNRAIHTVWQLAQRHRAADAVYGLTPAGKAVDARLRDPRRFALRRALRPGPSPAWLVNGAWQRVRGAVRAGAVRAVGRRVMRTGAGRAFWQAVATAPRLPARRRSRLARVLYANMIAAGQRPAAERMLDAVCRRLPSGSSRGALLSRVAGDELRRGDIPTRHTEAIATMLAVADAAHARGDAERRRTALLKAIRLMFHRVVHFDRESSPLSEAPSAYLAPLRDSVVGAALAAPRGRAVPAAPPPPGRPLRLLLVTHPNDYFIGEIRQRYADLPAVEVRHLDLGRIPTLEAFSRDLAGLLDDILTGGGGVRAAVEQLLRPHLDWADIAFVDWCSASAALLTLLDPGDTRVVVRLHSFEAYSVWPHIVDFSRVDDLVFVSEHLRDFTLAVAPRLAGPGAPRAHVIANAMDLHRYARAKSPDARFTLGLVGVGSIAKDPRWAVRVLRLLRERDPRYRLLLIGSDIDRGISGAARRYRQALERDIAELEPAGIVRRTGHVADVPEALADVGVILSTSLRESFHCGLLEGVASEAVPVVRNWPFFAREPHGAHTLFPQEWIVDSPEQAAEKILKLTATDDGWREAGRAAAAHAIDTWDWSVTRREFDRLFLGADAG